MTSYGHTAIAKLLKEIDSPPAEGPERASWVKAEKHLQLLRQNATSDELILHASSRRTFILAVTAKEADVIPPDHDDLLKWSYNPYKGRTYYDWNEADGEAGLEPDFDSPGPKAMERWQDLIFARDIPDVPDTTHYELLQEFAHAEGIHWREERHAYCTIDENGDWKSVVSVTDRSKEHFVLITCQREALERYLVATSSMLVRFFDFTMIPHREDFRIGDWGTQQRALESDLFFYNQSLHPSGYGYVRGTQLLPVLTPEFRLFRAHRDSFDPAEREHASFIVYDWRNGKVTEVSAAPGETANYFNAEGNSLPFGLSPAFFRPEVLLRYKGDRDKYVVSEENHTVHCRGAWFLKSYDVNDAGQVNAYLCDLRQLPYQEQLHWRSHNEEPKVSISARAYENHFLGKWSSDITPIERVLHTIRRWAGWKLDWWRIEDIELLSRINTPISDSKDEWGTAFLELSKVVVEGFRKKPIQASLRQHNVPFDSQEGTLSLLEKLITSQVPEDQPPLELKGLKEAQFIRSKVHSHNSGSEADKISRDALMEHGTYRAHFEWACSRIADELETVSAVLQTVCEASGITRGSAHEPI